MENIAIRALAGQPSTVSPEPPLSDEQVFNYIFTHSTSHFWGEEETDGVKILIYLPNSISYALGEKTFGHTALIVKNADDGVFYDYSYGRYMTENIDTLRRVFGSLGTGVFVKRYYEDTLEKHKATENENVYVYSLRYTDAVRGKIIDYIQKNWMNMEMKIVMIGLSHTYGPTL